MQCPRGGHDGGFVAVVGWLFMSIHRRQFFAEPRGVEGCWSSPPATFSIVAPHRRRILAHPALASRRWAPLTRARKGQRRGPGLSLEPGEGSGQELDVVGELGRVHVRQDRLAARIG